MTQETMELVINWTKADYGAVKLGLEEVQWDQEFEVRKVVDCV